MPNCIKMTIWIITKCRLGGETTEGTADGDARSPRQLHDPRTEPLHPDGGRVRRTVHRGSVSAGRLPRGHRLRHWDTARRHHHLPVLRDLCQGTSGDGRHEHTALLSLVMIAAVGPLRSAPFLLSFLLWIDIIRCTFSYLVVLDVKASLYFIEKIRFKI